MAPTLLLIGSPGAGKSTVGRRVAERLGVPFSDTDHLIEAAAGMTISDIFIDRGEAEFRQIEEDAVARALSYSDGVLALGGGAVMREETRARLAGHRVVWLRVTVGDAANRVGLNTARPLLLGNVRTTLARLLNERNPVYEAVATDIVDTSGRSLREVTDEVLRVVRSE
jgi:shikimate kinase